MECPKCGAIMTFKDNGVYSESYLICQSCGHKEEVERYSLANNTMEVKNETG